MRWSSIVVALCSLRVFVAALDTVKAYGNKFFNKDGSQFFIKGVAYQLRPQDPLVETDQCQRDANLMKDLGANTIRVYHVDPDADHDGCMEAFANAGIYVLADLDTFGTYIYPGDLFWNGTQYDNYTRVMDAFHHYDNILGFFIGNENIAKKEDSHAAPFLKAAARDMKAYRDHKGYRKIPIGYSAADIQQLRPMLQDYLTCGGNSSEIVDFFGLNSYSWCDPSTYEESSYNQLEEYAKDFPVPIFLSETGCIVPGPRRWDDQDAIFGEHMVNDWSGAIVYEWIQEENSYGLITYDPLAGEGPTNDEDIEGGFLRKGTPAPRNPDFDALKAKWANNNPTGVSKADYNPSGVSTRACPMSTQGGWWEVDGNVRLPTLGESFTYPPSATEDPTQVLPQSSTSSNAEPTGESRSKADHSSKDDKGNSASADKHIVTVGAVLAGIILSFSLLL